MASRARGAGGQSREKMMNGFRMAVAVGAIAVGAIVMSASTLVFADSGAELYKSRGCSACHGKDGAGQTTMGKNMGVRDLGSADVQKQSDEELVTIITKGKGRMPAQERKLSRDQIRELVKYIRMLKK
jgi:mono/diheme cytochrome c family protein